ncbi:MAG: aspartyl protease family protein [Elusimicrobia bacterium]|nr:aspartyl protease family protein [Elusimicrobiota bacterium]
MRYRTRFESGGAVSHRESLVELSTGRFRIVERRPNGDALDGWDGSLGWRRGRGLLVLAADQKQIATAAYMKARGYFFPGRWKADLRLLGTRTVEGRAVDAIEASPPGGSPVELYLDTGTHVPLAERYGSTVIVYEDYRETGGLRLPRRSRPSAGSPPFVAETEEVELDVEVSESLFALPALETSFTDGAPLASIPSKGGSFVEGRFGEAGPFPFLLDSAGFAQLTPALARRLAEGSAPNTPVTIDASFGTLAIASMTFLNSPGLGGVAASVFEGRSEAGVLGVETFLSLVVRLEPGGSVVFFRPEEFAPPENARFLPLSFEGGKPVVDGSVAGKEGRFILDTGSNAELTLFPEFAGGLSLPPGEPALSINGFMKLPGTRTKAAALVVGPVAIDEVSAIVLERKPVDAPPVSGIVGMGVLGKRAVTFDFRGRKVFLGD